MNQELLKILVCPENHQSVRLAEAEVMDRLNRSITEGTLHNRAGAQVTEALEGGLVREDGQVLYPIRDGMPVMLVEEAVPLDGN